MFNELSGSVSVLNKSAINLLEQTSFSADEIPFVTYLNENYLANKISPSNTEFNNPLLWKRVILFYAPSNSQQRKHLTFDFVSGMLRTYSVWDQYAQTGVWNLTHVIVVNIAGALLQIDSDNFSAGDNITIS